MEEVEGGGMGLLYVLPPKGAGERGERERERERKKRRLKKQ
jgi:hypothetical protein